jgi:putative toxin-antitoxin system antitoxin component (TIGR02293 family)
MPAAATAAPPPATAEALLGLKPTTPIALHDAILEGLPFGALTKFLKESGLPPEDVYAVLHISPRTLVRRKAAGQLSADESIHLHRLANLFEQTRDMFAGNAEAARDWLCKKRFALGSRRPIDLAQTPLGTKQVEGLIWQIDNGVYI